MKKRLKKILTTSIISAISATAIGCSSNGNMVAKNIDKSMADFVSSINNLDYVETTSPSQKNIGKIVETNSTNNSTGYLNGTINHVDVENAITKPSDRTDNFKLFILYHFAHIWRQFIKLKLEYQIFNKQNWRNFLWN